MPAYIHALKGRLRIKLQAVKGSTQEASCVQGLVQSLPGITDVSANPRTGNVLIFHDHSTTSGEIISALHCWGYLEPPAAAESAPVAELGSIVLRATTEFALQQLLIALI